MPKVLVVDDEEPLRASLSFALTREGYSVATAADGTTALEQARTFDPDAVLLDVMLPGIDGLEVCRRLRKTSDVPILMLTAKDAVADKIDGLQLGADDYVTKPFNTRELIARLQAALRRRLSAERLLEEDRKLVARMEELLRKAAPPAGAAAPNHQSTGSLGKGRVMVKVDSAEVLVDGEAKHLSREEYGLLRYLMSYEGQVVTRTELIDRIWGANAGLDGLTLLDLTVRTLSDKIEGPSYRGQHLVAVPGIGFRFNR